MKGGELDRNFMRDRFGTNIAQTGRTFTPQGEGTAMVRQVAEAVPVFSPVFILLISFLFIILFSSIGWSITPAGAIISNNAKATYTSSLTGNLTTSSSNTVSVTTAVQRTTAVIEFLQYAPTAPNAQLVPVPLTSFSPSGNLAGPFVPLGAPVPAGSTAPIDLTQPLPLVVPTQYHTGEPVFIRLSDRDQNNDPAVAETVVVTIRDDKTGDREVLRLTETGLNTGVFLGYVQSSIQPATSYNGLLSMVNDSNVIVSYTDSSDPADKTSVSALVDPYGIVFNSVTGQPVDGAIVTLVNAATGNPATVYGDDGIATFPSNLTTGGTAMDSSGRSYTMTPGGYRFPFISPGRYRLNILPPAGYRAPSTIATAVLQSLPEAPFAIAEPGSRNEVFLVNAGPAIRIDIPVDPLSTLLYLIKSAGKDSAAIGDFVPYQLTVENLDKSSPAPGVTITDRLPVGFRYRKGSARLNISPALDPAISEDGRSITFAVGALGAAANAEITYVAEVGAGASLGKAVNTAVAHGSSGAVSNNASATVIVSEDLFGSKTTIVGRVLEGCGDNGRGIAGIRIFLEDGSYVVTDKNGMYHFAALNAGTHVVQLDTVTVPEQYEPAQCQDNTRYAGRSFSQFVDLQGGSLWRADFHLVLLPPKAKQTGEVGLELRTFLVSTQTGSIIHNDREPEVSLATDRTGTVMPDANGKYTVAEGEDWARNPQSVIQTSIGDVKTMPDYDAAWVEKAGPELEWLWPVDGYHPAIASLRIAIKHDPSQNPKLFLNDDVVDILHYEGMIKKADGTVAISFWRGIHLQEGDNKFELVLSDGAGSEVKRLQRTIHYSGPPSKAVLLPERSKLIADGKNPIILAIQLLDKDGHPAREGVRADFFLDPPYIPKQSTDELQQSPLIAPNTDRYRYLIGDDGVAMIELVPTTQTGEAVVRVQLDAGRFEEIRTWLKPGDRDWVLVGLAEGTVGYDTVKGNMETFTSGGGDDKFYEEDRLAFYAKGRIKGEWLLTLAYDSRKTNSNDQPGLYQTIDPNKYYTLYGDGTLQGNDAASAKRIYVKLERDQFYALFGDFNAGLSMTELSRYSRNFTGFKSEMKTKDYEYAVFLADTNQAHVRDEFPGDGTSGLYHLSRKNIVLNSETITIETRDRFKSEVILSSQQLTNHLDYTIDYDDGTIIFKMPVYSRDGNFNPIFIVAEYESFDDSDAKYNYGGRAAARFLDSRVEVGASHIHEGQVGGSGNLEGVDAKVKLGLYDMIRAEAATTKTDQAGCHEQRRRISRGVAASFGNR